MSKRAETYAKYNYPESLYPKEMGIACQVGYEKAEKDIISIIESRISELLGDAQPTPILRYELRDLIKKIKEEEK